MINFWLLVLLALEWGRREQHIYRNGYKDTTLHVFNKSISVNYHFSLVFSWAAICYAFGYWYMLPAFMVIEDWSYFRFHPTDTLGPEDWVNFGFGGLMLAPDVWLPNVYIVGLGTTAALYLFFH